jgi:hypothetical protein
MRLRGGGIDIFYIDESNDAHTYIVTAVAIPFLRATGGIWQIVWPEYLEAAKDWRSRVRDQVDIQKEKSYTG